MHWYGLSLWESDWPVWKNVADLFVRALAGLVMLAIMLGAALVCVAMVYAAWLFLSGQLL